MKGNTKKGSVWGGTKVTAAGIPLVNQAESLSKTNSRSKSRREARFAAGLSILTLVFGFALVGCGEDGGSEVKRLISGFLRDNKLRDITSSVYGRSASLYDGSPTLPAEVKDAPFVLEMDTGLSAPARMTGLKGRVQTDGPSGKVIELKGLLDNDSGKFVAAGIGEELGIGFQIEGYYKGNTLTGAKVTVKEQNSDGEWVEMELPLDGGENATVSATATTRQTGLPSNWSGRYTVPGNAITFATEEDNALFQEIREDVFFIITPEGLSTGADYDKIEANIRSKRAGAEADATIERFRQNIGKLLPTMALSFLEITEKSPNTYWVLVFVKLVDTEGTVTEELFAKACLVRAADGNITLSLDSREGDEQYHTAGEARGKSDFKDSFSLTKR
jgi:hypothetical protein